MVKIKIKVCLLGDRAVGKTMLLKRYYGTDLRIDIPSTWKQGIDYRTIKITIDRNDIELQIWELLGGTDLHKVRSLFYNESRGFLLIFDLTRRDTYENVLNYWVNELKTNILHIETKPLFLLGNKQDLIAEPVELSIVTGQKLAKDLSQMLYDRRIPVTYYESSAKTGLNVLNAFEGLVRLIVKHL